LNKSKQQGKLTLKEQVIIDYCLWQELNHGLEIGGYGHVTREGNDFICDQIWLLTTSSGGAHMNISEDKVAEFLLQRNSDGTDMSNLFLHWHSHPLPMSPFFSGTDQKDIKEHLAIAPHLLAVVFSGPRKIVAKYVTREEEMTLKISLQLDKYYEPYVNRPKYTYRQVYQTGGHLPSKQTQKYNSDWGGTHRQLGSNAGNADGYWLRGEFHG
jgi:hypothetical protein